jgi:hypothetical protein
MMLPTSFKHLLHAVAAEEMKNARMLVQSIRAVFTE